MQILVASRNRKKLAEMDRILREHLPDVEVVGLDDVAAYDEPVEDQPTFAGNALLKAWAGLASSGLPTLADDSGLEVAALNGAPGVYSARYGGVKGAAQLEYLLKQLEGVPWGARLARFVCVIALARPGHHVELVEGTLPGVIELEPRGSGGFGYDPLFYLLDEDKTLAELPDEHKNRISHRAAAARAARTVLERWRDEGLI